jgi:hypothetical protein
LTIAHSPHDDLPSVGRPGGIVLVAVRSVGHARNARGGAGRLEIDHPEVELVLVVAVAAEEDPAAVR